ncbi:ABC transporter substrate-binding protein [Segatella copri]|uniref:ABC transporter substrate-binding protein n=1 Tax=Segatella copri TaxID=165179 RepID=UPI002FEF30EE
MMNRKIYIFGALLALLVLTACQGGKTTAGEAEEGDTLKMKYAKLLTIVKHGEKGTASLNNDAEDAEYQYAEVNVANPWKAGTMLHRYILIPKGEEGDKTVAMLAKRRSTGARCTTDTMRTPVESNLVFTAPHCQLLTELGCQNAITGVCDKDYINIPDIKSRAQADAKVAHPIMDCGSSMQPDIERIIALHPEALLISPFENSGGYGKLDKLRIPVIETADYMETSPLGRAEWIKLYGLLLGSSKADSLFSAIEKEYLQLKAEAAKLPLGLSILTERKTGNVWYVPGGKSTMGILLRDAHARYIFADDTHSGSLSMSPEQIIAKGNQVDVWAFKYFGGNALTKQDLLAEYQGYQALKAFQTGTVYETDTSCEPYFELTSFHPEILLREFIVLSHPEAGDKFGKLRFYKKY